MCLFGVKLLDALNSTVLFFPAVFANFAHLIEIYYVDQLHLSMSVTIQGNCSAVFFCYSRKS